jgi:hypothetical protein
VRSSLQRLAGPGPRRSFDNGAAIVGPGLTPLVNYAALQGLAAAAPFGMDMGYPSPGRFSEDHQRGLNAAMVSQGRAPRLGALPSWLARPCWLGCPC